jgi:ABC-type phosphate transport system substrate-binding protein
MGKTMFLPALVTAVVGALVLTACGGGEQTTSAGAQATQATAAVTSAAPTTAVTLPPSTTVAPTTAPACPDVSFSSNPEDVATGIQGTGVSCADAQALVRSVGPQIASTDSPVQVASNGYTCARTSLRSGDHGPALATFDCTNGPMKVDFTRALLS